MKTAQKISLIGIMVLFSAAVLASKARTPRKYYRPFVHQQACTITTLLFLTTTDISVGEPYEIATIPTTDSCVQYCVGDN
ncbi:MAG: hypothetical protein JO154_13520 [Chitinophaga sp.]|uniref:hypothetical protein n=1 Tax=Chitinophaga sp. TaxID=1869181 RepID=UPI0025C4BD6A|nr:hypothetical protein [Chitinophaga sp.]MBV8253621.1 hypothetical protein [Chitinophaga sp.]